MNMNVKYFSRLSLNRVLSQLMSIFSRCVLYLFLWNWGAIAHESELHDSREPNWQGTGYCAEVHCCPRQGRASQESFLVSDWVCQGHHCSTAAPKGHTTLKADCPRPYMLLLLLLSRFSCVQLCATPWTAAYQASPSVGFSRQEHWSGLPFPSPMHESGKWKWSRSVVSDS